jgi:hypothetical protein
MLASIPEEFLRPSCEATATKARFLHESLRKTFGVAALVAAATPKVFL